MKKNQRGMSLVGFIIVLTLVVFVAYLGMRIVPIYTEYYAVKSALQGVQEEYQSQGIPPHDIRKAVMDRLWISLTTTNVKPEDIKLVRAGGLSLRVEYQVRKPLIGNLDIIASFDESVRLSGT